MVRAAFSNGAAHGVAMTDWMYLVITVAFFAAMLGYTKGCEALGREADSETPQ
jgi:hypothetical protein